ncbi:MAG: type II secretion system F family protein [Elusimicrobiota bacterium]|jgi:tight adherence protein C|nr:type II secretion system F family protein [Elusimicrobiota bacterium]
MLILLISLLFGFCIFFIFQYILGNLKNIGREGIISNAAQNKKASIVLPTIFRWAKNLSKYIMKIKSPKLKNYADKLAVELNGLGGEFEKIAPYQFISLQLFSAILLAIVCWVFISGNFVLVLLSAFFALIMPYLYVQQSLTLRKTAIARQLPDTADLLSVMLESGLDFFGAADKVCKVLKGPLSDEFSKTISKIYLGYDRKLALTELGDKCGVDSLKFFVRTVIIALDAGVGMADTIRRLSLQMRQERASAAEKKAQEAPVKMLIPLVLFIFPTIFMVVFGPIAISFIQKGSL